MISSVSHASLSCVAFLTLAHADDPPSQKDTAARTAPAMPAVQLPAPTGDSPAAKELAEIVKAANAKLRKANENDTDKVLVESANKLLAHARKHPTDKSTFNILVTVIVQPSLHARRSPEGAKIHSDAVELMKTNFARTPFMRRPILQTLASGISDSATGIVREVIRHHPDKLTRAQAAKVLIAASETRVITANAVKKSDELRTYYGKVGVQELLDAEPQAIKDIETCRTLLRTELKGQLPNLEIGAVAPETIGTNLDGKTVKLSELKGKVVVLDFWTTSCVPCRKSIPHARELVNSMEGRPFVFVNISLDDEKEKLTEFVRKEPMPWMHWWDPKRAVAEQWELRVLGTLYVIDHQGAIQFKTESYALTSGKLEKKVEELVKIAEGKR